MQDKLAIGKRLKELRKNKKYSQSYIANKLFISQAAYSLIENSQNGIISDHLIGLSNLYEVTTDYILKGDEMVVQISPSQGYIPFNKVKAHAGFLKISPENTDLLDLEWYKVPGFNPTIDHRLFEVEGESMLPAIFPRDILICQLQNNWSKILDSSVVVVITKESILAKRFRIGKDPDTFLFENDNPEHPEILKFEKDDVREIFMVRGKISNSFVSYPQQLNQKRVETLEESIESLKKELYALSKKFDK